MPRPRPLFFLLTVLLCASTPLSAQETPPPPIETPLLTEWAFGPAIVGGGRWVPSSGAILLSLLWVGFQQEKGYRLGLMVSRADIEDALPLSPTEGMVRARNASALFVERIRIRKPAPWVIITGYGFGVGSLGYEFDNTRNDAASQSAPLGSLAPTLTASADVAWRVPFRSVPGMPSPVDLFIGLRSALMLGVRRVDSDIPANGDVPSKRGLGHVQHLSVGMRVGLFSDVFR